MAKDKLTPKQNLFIKEYLIDLNATQACIRAGYSEKTARSQGQRLLTNVDIQKSIEESFGNRADKLDLTAEWVLNNLKEVSQRCMQAEPVMIKIDGKPEPSGEYKFDSSGANKALELIGKHLKLFTDKVEHTGEIEIVIKKPEGL